ncbi:MAG: hypothetical protein IPN31_12525 [Bacteroidetes bacterium]|nr:hypothetical protein [Bacteroidota bacterium]
MSNERSKMLYPVNDSIVIDTLSILQNSERIIQFLNGEVVSNTASTYELDYFSSILILKYAIIPDSILITYKVFPFLFTQKYFHKDPAKLDSAELNLTPLIYESESVNPYLELDGLDYNGSLTRGISFGNNQDVVVNSSFNLQMSGKLQNDVMVSASISDNNIPIQPEGNTQQLQEFDKVFINVSKDEQALTIGDFELYKPEGYFMNYYKKSQGLYYQGGFHPGGGSLKTGISFTAARGLYVRQQLNVIEGNQGPYKLTGANGETYIIILAGTERVYADGILLIRGAENDYVIDYNSGEITFTPNQMVTKDIRVTIEFEYSDQYYFRSLITNSNTYTSNNNKLKLHFNIYSEQDSKNQPLNQSLDSTQRNVMENVGDSIQDAFVTGIDMTTFDATRIMYKLIDSLGFDSVFVYSTNPDSAQYVLSFTDLGINNGNYIVAATLGNGRTYKWVAPIDGVPQGSFEPVILLVTPKKTQMISSGFQYDLNANNSIGAEIAYSNKNVNTFSKIDNADNDGIAIQTNYANTYDLNADSKLQTKLSYEMKEKEFNVIERYRPVEFNRDWNIINSEKANEHYAVADFALQLNNRVLLNVNSTAFVQEEIYNGFKQAGSVQFIYPKWLLFANGSYLTSNADTISTNFFRPKLELTRIFVNAKGLNTGVYYEGEHNRFKALNDSLTTSSFYYDQFTYFLKSSDTVANTFNASVVMRNDKLPYAGDFVNANNGVTYNLIGGFNKNPNSRFTYQATYRTLEISDTALSDLEPESSILGRAQHSLIINRGLVTSDIFYELGTGQEPLLEFTYVEVEPGQGSYTWIDYNNNGVPELNEFEVAAFSDQANYIQVSIPTEGYIQSNISQFNYSIGINPKIVWFDSKGYKEFIGRFSVVSSLQLGKKVLDNGDLNGYNPFANVPDSLLVSSNSFWQNTLYFNRASSVFGIDYTYQQNFTKYVLTNGPESRDRIENRIVMRYKILKPLLFNLTFTNGNSDYISEAFVGRSYNIPFYTIEPRLNFISGSKYRITVYYKFNSSENIEGNETLKGNEITADIRYNVVTKSTITSRFSFVKNAFVGEEDSPVGYAMLAGLRNGNNILWNLNFDRRLSQILQLTISYEGRKTGTAAIVHVARFQLRAIF